MNNLGYRAISLSIAGSDSSAGAGIAADIKSAAAVGGYMATAITAITAQNGEGVSGVEIIEPKMVKAQIDAVASAMNVAAIKSGMLPSVDIVKEVVAAIEKYEFKSVVVDPVMVSTSGATLIPEDTVEYIVKKLFPLTTILTPNIIEATYITGVEIKSEADFDRAAAEIKKLGVKCLLMKGGHLEGGKIVDRFYDFAQEKSWDFVFDKIETKNTHGTGCSLSASIAAHLSQGFSPLEAVEKSENYIHTAIERGKDCNLGKGHGAIAHF